jgi:hypothetical protein
MNDSPKNFISISSSSRYPIELNKWHQCFIEIHGQKLTLIVDQESPVVTYDLFSNGILWPRSFTFIGNLPIQYRSFDMLPNSFVFEGFRGAIQKVIEPKKHIVFLFIVVLVVQR